MKRALIILALLAVPLAPAALPAQQAALSEPVALELGRKYTRWFYAAEIDSMLGVMRPEFIEQIGGPEGLEQVVTSTLTQRGLELEVIRESATPSQSGGYTYSRIVVMEADPDQRYEWTYSLDAAGQVVVAGLRPHSGAE